MATVKEIREGIAANLAALDGVQKSAYLLSNATPPTLMVMPGPPGGGDFTEYHRASQDGLEIMTFTVRAEAGVVSDIGGQMKVDEFLDVNGGSSVKTAVESDASLGGLVSDLIVTRSTAGIVTSQDGTSQKIAAEWEVKVYT
jgi:hypothetical protein